jgi:hypothetical protein
MNKGLALASGDYVNFLNAGDTFCASDTVGKIIDAANDDDLLYGDFNILDEKGRLQAHRNSKPFNYVNLMKFQVGVTNHQSIFIRKNACPEYDLKYRIKGELNWYFDILERNGNDLKIRNLGFPIVNFKSGGFGDRIFWEQIREMLIIMLKRTGPLGVGYALRNTGYAILYRNRTFQPLLSKISKFYPR